MEHGDATGHGIGCNRFVSSLQYSRPYSTVEGFAASFWSKWQGAKLDGHISKTQRL